MIRRSYLKIEYLKDTRRYMIFFTPFWHREFVKCTLPSSIWRCVISFIKKRLLLWLLFFFNAQANSSPTIFCISVDHIDLLLRIWRKFFHGACRTHSNNWKLLRPVWTSDLCLTAYNTHNRQIFMLQAALQLAIPPRQRP